MLHVVFDHIYVCSSILSIWNLVSERYFCVLFNVKRLDYGRAGSEYLEGELFSSSIFSKATMLARDTESCIAEKIVEIHLSLDRHALAHAHDRLQIWENLNREKQHLESSEKIRDDASTHDMKWTWVLVFVINCYRYSRWYRAQHCCVGELFVRLDKEALLVSS